MVHSCLLVVQRCGLDAGGLAPEPALAAFLGAPSGAAERCDPVNAQVSCSSAAERTWKVNEKTSARQLIRIQEQEEAFRNGPGSKEDQLTLSP